MCTYVILLSGKTSGYNAVTCASKVYGILRSRKLETYKKFVPPKVVFGTYYIEKLKNKLEVSGKRHLWGFGLLHNRFQTEKHNMEDANTITLPLWTFDLFCILKRDPSSLRKTKQPKLTNFNQVEIEESHKFQNKTYICYTSSGFQNKATILASCTTKPNHQCSKFWIGSCQIKVFDFQALKTWIWNSTENQLKIVLSILHNLKIPISKSLVSNNEKFNC